MQDEKTIQKMSNSSTHWERSIFDISEFDDEVVVVGGSSPLVLLTFLISVCIVLCFIVYILYKKHKTSDTTSEQAQPTSDSNHPTPTTPTLNNPHFSPASIYHKVLHNSLFNNDSNTITPEQLLAVRREIMNFDAATSQSSELAGNLVTTTTVKNVDSVEVRNASLSTPPGRNSMMLKSSNTRKEGSIASSPGSFSSSNNNNRMDDLSFVEENKRPSADRGLIDDEHDSIESITTSTIFRGDDEQATRSNSEPNSESMRKYRASMRIAMEHQANAVGELESLIEHMITTKHNYGESLQFLLINFAVKIYHLLVALRVDYNKLKNDYSKMVTVLKDTFTQYTHESAKALMNNNSLIVKLESQLEQKELKAETLNNQLTFKEKEIDILKESLSTKQIEINNLQQQLADERNRVFDRIEKSSLESSKFHEQNKELIESHRKQLSDLENMYQSKIYSLQQSQQKISFDNEHLQKSLSNTENRLKDLQEQCNVFKKERDDSNTSLQAASENIRNLESQLKETKQEKDKEISLITSKLESVQQLFLQNQKVIKDLEELKNSHSQSKLTHQEEHALELNRLSQQITEKEEIIKGQNIQCRSLEEKVLQLTSDFKQKTVELEETNKKLSWLQQELENYSKSSKDLASKCEEKDLTIAKLNNEIKFQNEKLQYEMDKRKTENNEKDGKLHDLQNRVQTLETELRDFTHKYENSRMKLELSEKKNEELTLDQNRMIEEYNKQKKELQAEVEKLNEKLHQGLEKNLSIERAHLEKVQELKDKIVNLEIENRALVSQLQETRKSLENLCSQKEQTTKTLEERKTEISQNLSEIQEKNRQLEKLNKKLSKKDHEISSLKSEKEILKQNLKEKEILLKENESKLVSVQNEIEEKEKNMKTLLKEREKQENAIEQLNRELLTLTQTNIQSQKDLEQLNNVIREKEELITKKQQSITELEKQNNNFTQKEKKLSASVENQKLENENLKHQLEKKEEDLKNLKDELLKSTTSTHALEQIKIEMEKKLVENSKEMENAQQMLKQVQEEHEKLTSTHQNALKDIENLNIQVQELKSMLDTKIQAISNLEKTNSDLTEKHETETSTFKTKKQEILTQVEQQKKEIEILKNNLYNKESALNQAIEQQRSLENSKTQLEQQVETLSHDLQNVKESLATLRRENERLITQHQNSLEEFEEHKNSAEKQIHELSKEKDSFAYEISELKHKLHEREELFKYQENHHKELQEKVMTTTVELTSITKDYEHNQQQVIRLEKELEQLKNEKNELSKTINEKEKAFEKQNSELLILQEKLANSRKEIETLKKEVNSKDTKLYETSERVRKLELDLKEAQNKLDTASKQMEAEKSAHCEMLQKQKIELENEISNLTEQFNKQKTDMDKNLNDLLQKNDTLKKERSEKEIQLHNQDKKIKELQQSLQALEKQVSETTLEYDNLQKLYEEEKSKYSQLLNSNTAQLQKIIEQMEKEKESHNHELQLVKQEFKDLEQKLQQEKDDLKEQLNTSSVELKSKHQELESQNMKTKMLQEELEKRKSEVEELQEQRKSQLQDYSKLTQELTAMKENHHEKTLEHEQFKSIIENNLKQKETQITQLETQMNAKSQEISELTQTLKSKNEDIFSMRGLLTDIGRKLNFNLQTNAKVSSFNALLGEIDKTLESQKVLSQQLQEAEKAVASTKQELEKSNKKIKKAMDKQSTLKQQHDNLNEQHKKLLENESTLKKDLEESSKQISDLNNHITTLHSKIKNLENALSIANQEKNALHQEMEKKGRENAELLNAEREKNNKEVEKSKNLMQELVSSKQELGKASKELATLRENNDQLNESLHVAESNSSRNIDELKKRLKERDDTIQHLEEEKQTTVANYISQLQGVQEGKNLAEVRLEKLEELNHQNLLTINNLKKERDDLKQDVAQLKVEISTLENKPFVCEKCGSLEKKLHDHEELLKKVTLEKEQEKSVHAKATISAIQHFEQRLNSEISQRYQSYETKITSLSTKLNILEKKLSLLKKPKEQQKEEIIPPSTPKKDEHDAAIKFMEMMTEVGFTYAKEDYDRMRGKSIFSLLRTGNKLSGENSEQFYSQELDFAEKALSKWLVQLVKDDFQQDLSLYQNLMDGVILCKYANTLFPEIEPCKKLKEEIKNNQDAIGNIGLYSKFCKDVGIQSVFEYDSLEDASNDKKNIKERSLIVSNLALLFELSVRCSDPKKRSKYLKSLQQHASHYAESPISARGGGLSARRTNSFKLSNLPIIAMTSVEAANDGSITDRKKNIESIRSSRSKAFEHATSKTKVSGAEEEKYFKETLTHMLELPSRDVKLLDLIEDGTMLCLLMNKYYGDNTCKFKKRPNKFEKSGNITNFNNAVHKLIPTSANTTCTHEEIEKGSMKNVFSMLRFVIDDLEKQGRISLAPNSESNQWMQKIQQIDQIEGCTSPYPTSSFSLSPGTEERAAMNNPFKISNSFMDKAMTNKPSTNTLQIPITNVFFSALSKKVESEGNLLQENTSGGEAIPLSARTPKSSRYEKNFENAVNDVIFPPKRSPSRKGSFAGVNRHSPPQQETESSPRRISSVTTPNSSPRNPLLSNVTEPNSPKGRARSNTGSPRRLYSPSPIQPVFSTTLHYNTHPPVATYSSGDDGDSEEEDSLESLIEVMKLCQSASDSTDIQFSAYFDDAQSFFETREQKEEFMEQFEGGNFKCLDFSNCAKYMDENVFCEIFQRLRNNKHLKILNLSGNAQVISSDSIKDLLTGAMTLDKIVLKQFTSIWTQEQIESIRTICKRKAIKLELQ